MSRLPVLVVASDDRSIRILEVTLRLGGFTAVARRSLTDARRLRADDADVQAIVIDLGPDSVAAEADAVRELLGDTRAPVVVILPEHFAGERASYGETGAHVLVRPYAPSALYAALEAARAATPDEGDRPPRTQRAARRRATVTEATRGAVSGTRADAGSDAGSG